MGVAPGRFAARQFVRLPAGSMRVPFYPIQAAIVAVALTTVAALIVRLGRRLFRGR